MNPINSLLVNDLSTWKHMTHRKLQTEAGSIKTYRGKLVKIFSLG